MNVRHLMGVLHSFSIKNIFKDKMDLRFFYFDVASYIYLQLLYLQFGFVTTEASLGVKLLRDHRNN